jgi:competence protein ComGC
MPVELRTVMMVIAGVFVVFVPGLSQPRDYVAADAAAKALF